MSHKYDGCVQCAADIALGAGWRQARSLQAGWDISLECMGEDHWKATIHSRRNTTRRITGYGTSELEALHSLTAKAAGWPTTKESTDATDR